MKKIVVFAGSNSSDSINQKLAVWVSGLISGYEVEVLKLTDYKISMFGKDLERESGYPNGLRALYEKIDKSDGLIISVPEHNGNLPAFFKNILDWLSRLERHFLINKRIFLLGTSPGRGGATSSIEITKKIFSAFKGDVVSSFSVPSFNSNFSDGITDKKLKEQMIKKLNIFLAQV